MPPELSVAELSLAFVITLVGSLIQGSIGFGFNLLAVPLLALIDIRFVPGPIIMAALVLSILVAHRDRASINIGDIGWAVFGRVPGTLLGVLTLRTIAGNHMGLVVGFLVCAAVALSSCGLPIKVTTLTLFGAGMVSGFMGTTVAIGGPALILLFQHQPGGYVRGTLSGYFVVGASMTLVALTGLGQFGLSEFRIGLLLLPGVILGFVTSKMLLSFLDHGYIRIAILIISAAAGVLIILLHV